MCIQVAHEMKILKHKAHGNHNDHCTAIAKDMKKIREKILNAVNKCVSNHMDEAINVEQKIVRDSQKLLTKTEDVINEAAQCVVSDVLLIDAIACLDNVST